MPNVQKVCLVRLSVLSFMPFVWYARYKIVNYFSKWWHTQWLNAPTYRTFWMKPLLLYMHYCMWSDTLSHLPASLVSSMSLQNGIHSIHPLNFFPFSLLCKKYTTIFYICPLPGMHGFCSYCFSFLRVMFHYWGTYLASCLGLHVCPLYPFDLFIC
jgi:hypothetical protein